MNVEDFYNKSEYSKIDFGSNPTLFTKKELLDFANEYLEAITVTRCCETLPTFDESNLNKNEYADDVQKTIHKNLCKPSYKIGWENCYGWLKQSLNK
ncbi:MAG: hypothetical protein ACPGRW_05995 [Flavobacteriaceae bacterium]